MHLDVTSPPHLITDLILIKDFFSFPWNHGVTYGHIVWASSCINEWKTAFGVISKFDPDATSLRWRSRTKRCAFVLKLNPFELSIIVFFWTLTPGHLVASWPRFWWWTWNRMWRLLRNKRYFYLRMVFSSQRWTLSLVARSNLSIAF